MPLESKAEFTSEPTMIFSRPRKMKKKEEQKNRVLKWGEKREKINFYVTNTTTLVFSMLDHSPALIDI